MWNPFKKQKDTQDTWVLGQNMNIDVCGIPLDKGFMESANTYEAWYLVPRWFVCVENDIRGRELKEDQYIQILSERNCIPLPLGLIFGVDKRADVEALTDIKPIAREKFREEKNLAEQSANKNKFLMNAMVIAGGAMACLILVLALIWLFQSGKLQLPF
jgi:hypothetical protein